MGAHVGRRPRIRSFVAGLVVVVVGATLAGTAASATERTVGSARPDIGAAAGTTATPIGVDADGLGTSWYPDADLPPDRINTADFGERFSTQLDGQIYAQPIIADGVLLVVTENDTAYGLDPSTGAILWTHNFGTPWDPSVLNCGDLTPTIGITGTPVVDPATGTAYFTTDVAGADDAASWSMQAVDVRTGAEASGFPVAITGPLTNDPDRTFDAEYQMQRPGLALVHGVVYAAFGSHCDYRPYEGLIAGVGETGGLVDLWSDEIGQGSEAGIWGPGGLVTDADGNIYFATGNGSTAPAGPGLGAAQPGGSGGLGECVVKLSTSTGTLRLADYFCPSDAAQLNSYDGDLGSGSPTGLPASFGTSATPDLLVEVGKAGELYLLDRDDLGGVDQGAGGTDDVIEESGPLGGAWSHPAVWPGDGGYVYVTTGATSGIDRGTGEVDIYQRVVTDGQVSLDWVGDAPGFPFGSSSPIVSSSGTAAGSGVVWVVKVGSGDAQSYLQAYGAVPVPATGSGSGSASLPMLWQSAVGNSTKFNPPLAAGGMVYLGNKNGQILAFGAVGAPPALSSGAVTAPDTTLGSSSSAAATLTASGPVTVTGISVRSTTPGADGAFTAGAPSPALPATLAAGDALRVPLTFTPGVLGGQQGDLTVTTKTGTVQVALSGDGLASNVPISTDPTSIDFGTLRIGGAPASAGVRVTNTSDASFTLDSVTLRSGTTAPFSLSGDGTLPASLSPGQSRNVQVTFTPPKTSGDFTQSFSDAVDIVTSAGDTSVPLAGGAAPGPQITIGTGTSAGSVDLGTVPVGQSGIASFTVGNRGGTNLTIEKSKPPVDGGVAAGTARPEATVIAPHTTLTETVRFAPTTAGRATSSWVIAGDDGTGEHTVRFAATATREHLVAGPSDARWLRLGAAKRVGRFEQLTPADPGVAGLSVAPTPVATDGLRASFTLRNVGGSGGDGATLALLDASGGRPRHAGHADGSLGLGGLPAVGVALQTTSTAAESGANTVGVVTSAAGVWGLHWSAASSEVPPLRSGPVDVTVTVDGSVLTVWVDGFVTLHAEVHLPRTVYVGFTAATGGRTDRHLVSAVQLAVP
jgi:hypothetical protein